MTHGSLSIYKAVYEGFGRDKTLKMAKDKLKLIFMGTPVFALPILEAAIRVGDVTAVVTQPDRPSGRKRKITPPPVKTFALRNGIKVFQPENISHPDLVKELQALKPDLIVAAAYGSILKRSLLELPGMGCINIHPSLLPRYRGACPIEWTLIRGETVTGVSCICMNEEMDSGDIIVQRKLDISLSDTTGSLRDKLFSLGAQVLTEVVHQLREGTAKPRAQKGEPTYAPMLSKKDLLVNWKKSALEIHNFVRALSPHPGARTYPDGESKRLIVWETALSSQLHQEAGKVLAVSDEGIVVSTGKGCLLLKCVQPEGGKKQTGAEYIRGHDVKKFPEQ